MNQDKQRIAIAEACGWKRTHDRFGFTWTDPQGRSGYVERSEDDGGPYHVFPPDYLNDLNAMHEAERTLNWDQQKRFIEWLVEDAIHDEYCTEMLWDSAWVAAHARASRRAEAFLRAIGKWEDA